MQEAEDQITCPPTPAVCEEIGRQAHYSSPTSMQKNRTSNISVLYPIVVLSYTIV
jgi:hypothetical protein